MNRVIVAAAVFSSLVLLGGCDSAPLSEPETEAVGSAKQAATVVNHFTWHGGNLTASWGNKTSWYSVGAYESTSAGQSTAYLNFNGYSADPTSKVCVTETAPCKCLVKPCTCEPYTYEYCYYTRETWTYGSGSISPEALHVGGQGGKLEVDLATTPGFAYSTCTVVQPSWDWVCTDSAPPGGITMTWKRTNEGSNFWAGVNQSRYGKYFWRQNGNSRSFSAQAEGSFLGTAVSSVAATVGSGVNVMMDRTPAPAP